MGKVLLGTSGWSYDEWVGPFYPANERSKLQYYTSVFPTAEIDSTFYAYHANGLVLGWVRNTPRDFVFTAKLPKIITHEKMMDLKQGVEEDFYRFIQNISPLHEAGKLGCLLVQMPPAYNFDLKRLEEFFTLLPRGIRFAAEFRNKTWMRSETWSLLDKHNVAYAVVDEPLLPPDVHITADFAYLRWHGHGRRPWFDYRYSKDELEVWVPRIEETAEEVKEVYGYFNNHFHGYAPENCLQVLEMLGKLTPEQVKAKERINSFRRGATMAANPIVATTLGDFASVRGEDEESSGLLESVIDLARLKRAKEIADSEIAFTRMDEVVEGKIKEYRFRVDLKNKSISHDCADWGKIHGSKKLCKHIGKIMLKLPRPTAIAILKELGGPKEKWTFEVS